MSVYHYTFQYVRKYIYIQVCRIIERYLVFVSSSWHRAPKTLRISWVMRVMEVLFVPVKLYLAGPNSSFRVVLVARKTKPWLEGWNSQPQGALRRTELLETELIINSLWYNLSCPHNGASINDRVQGASGLVNTLRCWEGGMCGTGMGCHIPTSHTPNPALHISLILLFQSCIVVSLNNKLEILS